MEVTRYGGRAHTVSTGYSHPRKPPSENPRDWAARSPYGLDVLERSGLARLLADGVDLSDSIYFANHGEPEPKSIARRELDRFEANIEAATGRPNPLRGAYFDAEGKIRALNDLIRSAAVLLARPDTVVGYDTTLRAAMETAARLYWVLAPDGDHLDRCGRYICERLRAIDEVSKLGHPAKTAMAPIRADLLDGAARAGITVPGRPAATDLVAALVHTPSVLRLGGLDHAEAAAVFYRIPSASTHATLHGVVPHFADPSLDPTGRRTTAEPLEHTLAIGAGLYAGFTTVHRALLVLYGWETAAWDRAILAAGTQIVEALDSARAT